MADIAISRGAPGEIRDYFGFRVNWGGIFAGFVVTSVVQVVLGLFGIAVGFFGWNPGDPLASLGTGTLVWGIIVAVISLFVGGLVAGRMAGVLTRNEGVLYGFVLWSLSTLVAVWLVWKVTAFVLGSALGIVGGAVSTTTGALVGGAAQVGAAAVANPREVNLSNFQREVQAAVEQTRSAALQAESTPVQTSPGAAPQSLGTAADTLAARASRTAQSAAQDVKHAMVRMAWLSLLAMVLSAIAAILGTTITARTSGGWGTRPDRNAAANVV